MTSLGDNGIRRSRKSDRRRKRKQARFRAAAGVASVAAVAAIGAGQVAGQGQAHAVLADERSAAGERDPKEGGNPFGPVGHQNADSSVFADSDRAQRAREARIAQRAGGTAGPSPRRRV